MKLLNIIKVGLFASILVMHNASAMERTDHQERELELFNYHHTAEKFMRELPLMTVNLIKYRYNRCDDAAKKDIDKKLAEIEDKFSSLLLVTWTKLPKEIIEPHLNKELLFIPSDVPVIKVFENYSWALKVYEGKKGQHLVNIGLNQYTKYVIKKQLCKSGNIFRHADAIKQANCYFKKQEDFKKYTLQVNPVASRNAIEFLDVLNKKIKDNDGLELYKDNIAYNCYDTYTVKNFLNKFKNQRVFLWGCGLIVSTVIAYRLADYIELNYCQRILTENAIQYNEAAKLFNEELKVAKPEIEKHIEHFKHAIAPYKYYHNINDDWTIVKRPITLIKPNYSWPDVFKFFSPILADILFWGRHFCNNCSYIADTSMRDCCMFLMGELLSIIFIDVLLDSWSNLKLVGVLSVGSIGLACIKTIYDMRKVSKCEGTLDDLAGVVKRHHDREIVVLE